MKRLTIIFFIPLLIAILGNGFYFQYDTDNIAQNFNKTRDQSKKIIIKRKKQFVPQNFAYTEHDVEVSVFGILLIFVPFVYFPFKGYYKTKSQELSIMLRNVGNDTFGQILKDGATAPLIKEAITVYLVYLVVYNLVIIAIAKLFNFSVCMYSLLVYERFVNFLGWLFH